PFIGQQLVVQQIQTKRFETPTILHIARQMGWPLALVPLTATRILLFQTLMFNDLDRFVRYFDFLAARQDRSFNLGQTCTTTLAIFRTVLDDFVRFVAELERFPGSSLLPTRLALRFGSLTRGLSQAVTGRRLV